MDAKVAMAYPKMPTSSAGTIMVRQRFAVAETDLQDDRRLATKQQLEINLSPRVDTVTGP